MATMMDKYSLHWSAWSSRDEMEPNSTPETHVLSHYTGDRKRTESRCGRKALSTSLQTVSATATPPSDDDGRGAGRLPSGDGNIVGRDVNAVNDSWGMWEGGVRSPVRTTPPIRLSPPQTLLGAPMASPSPPPMIPPAGSNDLCNMALRDDVAYHGREKDGEKRRVAKVKSGVGCIGERFHARGLSVESGLGIGGNGGGCVVGIGVGIGDGGDGGDGGGGGDPSPVHFPGHAYMFRDDGALLGEEPYMAEGPHVPQIPQDVPLLDLGVHAIRESKGGDSMFQPHLATASGAAAASSLYPDLYDRRCLPSDPLSFAQAVPPAEDYVTPMNVRGSSQECVGNDFYEGERRPIGVPRSEFAAAVDIGIAYRKGDGERIAYPKQGYGLLSCSGELQPPQQAAGGVNDGSDRKGAGSPRGTVGIAALPTECHHFAEGFTSLEEGIGWGGSAAATSSAPVSASFCDEYPGDLLHDASLRVVPGIRLWSPSPPVVPSMSSWSLEDLGTGPEGIDPYALRSLSPRPAASAGASPDRIHCLGNTMEDSIPDIMHSDLLGRRASPEFIASEDFASAEAAVTVGSGLVAAAAPVEVLGDIPALGSSIVAKVRGEDGVETGECGRDENFLAPDGVALGVGNAYVVNVNSEDEMVSGVERGTGSAALSATVHLVTPQSHGRFSIGSATCADHPRSFGSESIPTPLPPPPRAVYGARLMVVFADISSIPVQFDVVSVAGTFDVRVSITGIGTSSGVPGYDGARLIPRHHMAMADDIVSAHVPRIAVSTAPSASSLSTNDPLAAAAVPPPRARGAVEIAGDQRPLRLAVENAADEGVDPAPPRGRWWLPGASDAYATRPNGNGRSVCSAVHHAADEGAGPALPRRPWWLPRPTHVMVAAAAAAVVTVAIGRRRR